MPSITKEETPEPLKRAKRAQERWSCHFRTGRVRL
jgi:hypothetical protein